MAGKTHGFSGGSACKTPSATTAADASPAVDTAKGTRSRSDGSDAGTSAEGPRSLGLRPEAGGPPASKEGFGAWAGTDAATSGRGRAGVSSRSEEHTSELQSQSNLACR